MQRDTPCGIEGPFGLRWWTLFRADSKSTVLEMARGGVASQFHRHHAADGPMGCSGKTAVWGPATEAAPVRGRGPQERCLETPRNRRPLQACMKGVNRMIGLMRIAEQKRDKAAISAIQQQCECSVVVQKQNLAAFWYVCMCVCC